MKKYIKPVMEVTEVEVGVILAGSGTPSSTLSSEETIDDASQVLARPSNGSLWDEFSSFFIIRYREGASLIMAHPLAIFTVLPYLLSFLDK